MLASHRFSAFLLLLLSTSSASQAEDDPFLGGKQLSPTQFYKRCESRKMAEFERGGCYSDVVRGLTTQLKAEIAKKLVQIDSIADDKPEAGILAGKETAARWRADFLLTQKLWEDYSKRQCQNYVDYENYGGSGAYQAALGCEIRHLVARLNEVRSST